MGSIRIEEPPLVYVPCDDGSVAVLVAIKNTPETRAAGVGIVRAMQDAHPAPEPLLVLIDYRYASVVTLTLAEVDAARDHGVESSAQPGKEPR